MNICKLTNENLRAYKTVTVSIIIILILYLIDSSLIEYFFIV